MLDTIKNALFASLGLAAITQEKLKELVEELVKRGELSTDQGKKVFEELWAKSQVEGRALSDRIANEVQRLLEKAPLASRRELQLLENRVKVLESKGDSPAVSSGDAASRTTGSTSKLGGEPCGLDEDVGV